eukprot:sb/3470946/
MVTMVTPHGNTVIPPDDIIKDNKKNKKGGAPAKGGRGGARGGARGASKGKNKLCDLKSTVNFLNYTTVQFANCNGGAAAATGRGGKGKQVATGGKGGNVNTFKSAGKQPAGNNNNSGGGRGRGITGRGRRGGNNDQNTQVKQLQLLAQNQRLLQKQLQQLQTIQSRQNELLLQSSSSGSRHNDSFDGDRDVMMF